MGKRTKKKRGAWSNWKWNAIRLARDNGLYLLFEGPGNPWKVYHRTRGILLASYYPRTGRCLVHVPCPVPAFVEKESKPLMERLGAICDTRDPIALPVSLVARPATQHQ